jgi:hypothetical protein
MPRAVPQEPEEASLVPRWQAIPPACSTMSTIASPSQSSRTSRTRCTWPEDSPLRQSLPRERDQ